MLGALNLEPYRRPDSSYANAAMVGAMGLAGMAHEGIDSIPQTGTWLLEKGERVTTAETSAKLDKTLSDIQNGGSGNGSVVNINNAPPGTTARTTRDATGRDVIDVLVADVRSGGKASRAIGAAFGVRRKGR